MMPKTFLPITILLLTVCAAGSTRAAGLQVLRHRSIPLTPSAMVAEHLPATNRIRAAICLPLRNQAALTNLLHDIQDPASPNFHQYLTPGEFTEQFGPTKQDYAAVVAFAQAQGLTVTATHANRMLVDVGGSVADVERTFHTNLRVYRHPRENRSFHAPDTAPSIDLAVPVLSVCGLDDYFVPHSAGLRRVPAGQAVPQNGSGPTGSLMGYDYRKAYAPGVTLTGAGQTVGLVQFDGYYPSDIASYVSQAGLPGVPLQNVLLDGYSGTPGGNSVEVAMDIELVVSMAPGLDRVIVYECDPSGAAIDVLNRMALDDLANQLSASWTWGTLDPGTDQVFQEFAAQGQSYFNASGDYDAYDPTTHPIADEWAPVDDPYITVVGGTTLTTDSSHGWAAETVWNWGGGSGTGGGISTTYAIPAWQKGVSMAANQGSTTMRNLPDVAMAADNIWVIHDNGQSDSMGGTSAATPLWAAFTALVNQQAAARGLPSVGFLNPAIYAIGLGSGYSSAFHDIKTGNNTWSGSLTKFYAVAGYDLCTGWGAPAGQGLIDALTASTEPLNVSPTTTILSSGAIGGPFNVTSQTYVVSNFSSSNSMDWTCTSSAAWLDVSTDGGTLSPDSNLSMTASLNAAAYSLDAGIYSASVQFTDVSSRAVKTRTFNLLVGQPLVQNGGFENGDFSGWTQFGNTSYTSVSAKPNYVHSGTYGMKTGPSGSLGYLAQTVATVAGQNYQVSFWLNVTDNNGPNEVKASWNGKAQFDQINHGTAGWTNVQFVVTATDTTSSLTFGFRDDPVFLAFDDVTVAAVGKSNSPTLLTLTVQSAYGGALPGSTNVLPGTTLSQRIVNSPLVNGGTQYVCTGATVANNGFTRVNATNITLKLTNNATLTWNWQTQYLLTAAVSGSGTVTPGGWQVSGTSAVLTATAGSAAHFVSWSGDTNGCLLSGNVLTAPMTQARSITAVFAAGTAQTVSGRITQSGSGAGVAGVAIQFSNGGGTATTGTNGNYTSPPILSVWIGTATPTYPTGVFSPTNRTYSPLATSQTAQNYTWTPPTIAIASPAPGQRIGTASMPFTVSGTMPVNAGVTSVWWQVNADAWQMAATTDGWKDWSGQTTAFVAGSNTVRAFAVDSLGVSTPTQSVAFTYVVTALMTVQTTGSGTVTTNYNGQQLVINQTYRMTAAPATGFGFVNWTDGTSAPVTTNRTVTFTMQSNLVLVANFADVVRPAVKITVPTAAQRILTNTTTVTVGGTASDNSGVSRVMCRLNSGTWATASGTTNWSALVSPAAGANAAQAYSVDLQGNVSPTSSVAFTYVPGAVMTVRTNGSGTVSVNYNKQMLALGTTNSMTATAATGFAFHNWTDGVGAQVTTNRKVSFVMQPNLVLVANFVDTQRPVVTITAPTSAQKISGTNMLFTIRGTAKDNGTVTSVWYQVTGSAWQVAGTTNGWLTWTAAVTMVTGSGTVRAYAADGAGNVSPTSTVSFTRLAPAVVQKQAQASAVPAPAPVSTSVLVAAPPSPELLHTTGMVLWRDEAAVQVRAAQEILKIRQLDGLATFELPVPASAAPQITIKPPDAGAGLAAGSLPELLLIRNDQGMVAAHASQPGTIVTGPVALQSVGDTVILSWDLTVFRP